MLVVSGAAKPVSAIRATASQRSGSTCARSAGGSAGTAPARRDEPRARHPPRLACGAVAAREPYGRQMPDARERPQVAEQQLAAPRDAVGTVPGPVVDRADGGAGEAVLGQARREVRVVVLDADELDAVALERIARGQVLGVQVVRDDLGTHVEEPLEVRDALAERRQRLGVAQVPDVMADPRPPAAGDAERALELRAAGEDGGAQGTGSAIAAGTSPRDRRRTVVRPATTRATESSTRVWIGRSCTTKQVGDPGQPRQRVLVAERDRLVADTLPLVMTLSAPPASPSSR